MFKTQVSAKDEPFLRVDFHGRGFATGWMYGILAGNGILLMQTGEDEAWFCARTQPKHENIAAASLTRHLRLEVFHPRLKLERRTRRGVVRVVEPLFPCYIFVRTAPEQLDEVRYMTGISSLVRFGDRAARVADPIIDELKMCFQDSEPMSVEDHLIPGAEVIVSEGAFLGFRGIVVQLQPARKRVQILLDFLGRTTLTEVDRKSVTVENRCIADLMPALALPRAAVAA